MRASPLAWRARHPCQRHGSAARRVRLARVLSVALRTVSRPRNFESGWWRCAHCGSGTMSLRRIGPGPTRWHGWPRDHDSGIPAVIICGKTVRNSCPSSWSPEVGLRRINVDQHISSPRTHTAPPTGRGMVALGCADRAALISVLAFGVTLLRQLTPVARAYAGPPGRRRLPTPAPSA